ncbi:MAG: hypothetical protein AB7I18_02175 [Candidatus Berkiella sp.]
MWPIFLEAGHIDLLKVNGVMPDEIKNRDLKHLIKTHAEGGNVEALEILIPYAKKQGLSLVFGEGELNLANLDKKQTVAVVQLLDNLTSATKRPASVVSSYQRKPSAANADVEREEPEEKVKKGPKKQ